MTAEDIFSVSLILLFGLIADLLIKGLILFVSWKKSLKKTFLLSLLVNLVSFSTFIVFVILSFYFADILRSYFKLYYEQTAYGLIATVIILKMLTVLLEIKAYSKIIKKNPEKFVKADPISKKRLSASVFIANIFCFSNLYIYVLIKSLLDARITPCC
jgi:hypothetical protein